MNRIKELRIENDMTQKELANKIGCSESIIGHYENGYRKPSYIVLQKLSIVFDKSVDYIMGTDNSYEQNIKYTYDNELKALGLSFDKIKSIDSTTKKEIKNYINYIMEKNSGKEN